VIRGRVIRGLGTNLQQGVTGPPVAASVRISPFSYDLGSSKAVELGVRLESPKHVGDDAISPRRHFHPVVVGRVARGFLANERRGGVDGHVGRVRESEGVGGWVWMGTSVE